MYSKISGKIIFIAAIIFIAIVSLGILRALYYIKSPNVLLLTNRVGAQWIKYDSEFELEIKPASQTKSQFKYVFNTNGKIDDARITLQALKSAKVLFDGVDISPPTSDFNQWKKVHDIKIPFTVKPGAHEIFIIVTSENSHPSVIAYSETIPVKTGVGWFVSIDGKNWHRAVPASQIRQPEISKVLPSSFEALIGILPYLMIVFVIVLLISWFANGHEGKMRKYVDWVREPSHIRWMLLFLWTVLSVNNMFKLNFQVGPDIWGHIDYINYLVTKWSLPPFFEGWQTSQMPLNYVLNIPLYTVLIKYFDLSWIVKMLRIIPIVCGLLQIEIVYRTARLVFADRKDLQIIAIITGSVLPIHTYACQYVGNEPLTGCLISLMILLCISLIMPGQKVRRNGYYVWIGFVWGLALLSKATALTLAPVVIIVLLFHMRLAQRPLNSVGRPAFMILGVSTLIAGWMYFRTYIAVGNFFAMKITHTQALNWWQDPGYRTWSQIFSFGQSLVHPVYSGVASFWDMLYSTLWLDGFNSGLVDFVPWNENFMLAGAPLAILPSVFILTGLVFVWLNKMVVCRNAVTFSICTIALFLVVLLDFYMVHPIYSVIKASYTLGLLPCYTILVAAGMEPFLRNRIIRSVAVACFACWAFTAYAAYFVVKF
jgi:hypothetical protein